MAQFTEAQRVQIRDALGFAALFEQADPRLENAITAIQAIADGGNRPDNSSQLSALAIVCEIQGCYCQLLALRQQLAVLRADKVHIDAARAIIMVRSEGRRLVTRLSAALSTNPRRDIFSASEPKLDSDAFYPAGDMFRRG